MKFKKNRIAFLFLSLLVFILVACQSTKKENQLTEINLVLDWTPNTNHTGIYVAQNLKYFQEAGLKVNIIQPPEDGATMLVGSGKAQFGISFQDSLADSLAQNIPVTSVAAIMQHNTSGILSLKTKQITRFKDLENKTYATWNWAIEQTMLKTLVQEDGGDFNKVKLISTSVENVELALKTNIDSVWIYYGWDGIAAENKGLATNFIALKDLNTVFDYYTPLLIANNQFIKEQPNIVKKVVQAIKKGYLYAIKNPEEAATILLESVPELDKDLVMKSQLFASKNYLADAKDWGYIDEKRWNTFYQWLNTNHLTEKNLLENEGFTNDFLTIETN